MRNPNLEQLYKAERNPNIKGCILEGSGRSGKTWSSIDFIIYLAARQKCEIIITRETYNSFKTTLYNDFNNRLPMAGFPSPFLYSKDVSIFWLFDSKIMLMGADTPNKYHGASSDYFFMNEAIDQPMEVFNQLKQRCRRFWWMDYNPKYTDHWIYDKVCGRPDVTLFKSTFLDNPHASATERDEVLSYDPGNPDNVANGTADAYMWKVYGLGERAAREGLVFPDVTWIDHFPDNCELVTYGLDFGYTHDPSALTRCGRSGMNLYLEGLFYAPTDNVDLLFQVIQKLVPEQSHIWADPSGEQKGMISDLRFRGVSCIATNTFPGSVKWGIDIMRRFKIHIVRDKNFRKEQENYVYRQINGISLNEPVDKFNHYWDSARMAVMSEFRVT